MYFILLHFVDKRSGVARFQRALAGAIAPQKSKAKAQVLARYIREKQFSVKCISIARPVENIMRFRYIVVPYMSRDRKVFPFRNNIYDVSPLHLAIRLLRALRVQCRNLYHRS